MEIYRDFDIIPYGGRYRVAAMGCIIATADSLQAAKNFIDSIIFED